MHQDQLSRVLSQHLLSLCPTSMLFSCRRPGSHYQMFRQTAHRALPATSSVFAAPASLTLTPSAYHYDAWDARSKPQPSRTSTTRLISSARPASSCLSSTLWMTHICQSWESCTRTSTTTRVRRGIPLSVTKIPINAVFSSSSSSSSSFPPLAFHHRGVICRAMSTIKQKGNGFPQKRKSYYEDLEVSEDASRDEIHRAFLRLAKIHHPDIASSRSTKPDDLDSSLSDKQNGSLNQEGTSQTTFHRIQNAYNVLSDSVLRREYDWKLRGIWKHHPSYVRSDTTSRNSFFYRNETRQQRHVVVDHEENQDRSSDASRARRSSQQYAEQTAREEALEHAAHLEYSQLMRKRFREIGRQKEETRREAYARAHVRYQRNIGDTEDGDDQETPTGQDGSKGKSRTLCQLLDTWRGYINAYRRTQRIVTESISMTA